MIKALDRICMDTNVLVRLHLFSIKTNDTVNKNTKTTEPSRMKRLQLNIYKGKQ